MKTKLVTAGFGALSAVAVLVLGLAPAAQSAPSAGGNACANPLLADDLQGWGPLDDAAVTRVTAVGHPLAHWAFDTKGTGFYLPQLDVNPGEQWTIAADDQLVARSGTARMAMDFYDASGGYLGQQNGAEVAMPAGGAWTHVAAGFTVPAHATTAHPLQFADTSGTDVRATACDYEQGSVATTPPTTPTSTTPPNSSDKASDRYGWGPVNPAESDEYDESSLDTAKWGKFGTTPSDPEGCSPGFDGHGQRCGSQTVVGNGYLSVTGTAEGKTGGLYSNHDGFKYGRVEVRERAVPLQDNGGEAYHTVPLLFPESGDYTHAEIDFAERDVASPDVDLFVHHDGDQSHCSVTIDSTQFHNYAIDWQPGSVTWYVDGDQVCTVDAAIGQFDSSNGGAQMDMFPDSGTTMRPAREDVDWIHMFPTAATQYGE
jgi:hypothetical protein